MAQPSDDGGAAPPIGWAEIHRRLDLTSARRTEERPQQDFAERMAQRAEALAAPEHRPEAPAGRDLVAFARAGRRYAVEIAAAGAVVPIEDLVRLPGVGPEHLGLLMHQGLLYAVVDPGVLLDLPQEGAAAPAFAVLLDDPGCAIGLAADALLGLVRDAAPLPEASGPGLVAAVLPDGASVLKADALALSARLVVDHRLRPSSPP